MTDKAKGQVKTLLICGAIMCPLFIIAVLIEGAVRPDYNSFLYPLSSLSIGDNGWTQISNFIITGVLVVLFSRGVRQVFPEVKFRGHLLIMLVGIGLIGAGIFVTDPVFGYPPNKPLVLRQFTWHGHLHDVFSMLVFICLPWACFIFRRRFIKTHNRGWATYSAFTGFVVIVTFILASIGFKQTTGFVNFAGLFQRLCILTGLAWITSLSLHLLVSKHESEF
jgi:Protein of unknown function (DUF998)